MDKDSSRRLKDYLHANFYLGNISPGDRLASHRELSKQLRISPMTALRLYGELGSEGLLDLKQRSGTFLKSVGIQAERPPRDAEMFRMIRSTVDKVKRMNASPKYYARLLLRYIGADIRDDFKFGFITHREAYDLATTTLQQKGVTLPLVRLSPDPSDSRWVRAVLARDTTIKCLLTTYLHVDFAIQAATEFDRYLLLARPDRSAQSFFEVVPGRRRYILARDTETAGDLRSLLKKIFDPAGASRFTIASLEEEETLREMERNADEILVTPLARPYAIARFGSSKRVLPLPNNLSDDTIYEMMFHYLFA